ncbi:MAG: isoaspartyl peptidase/L-asparaginase family protein [Nitrososphaeraceae archaeon]|nr:isoaspartyl peptidase/L-asparaginase [Nitrososphaeraceae archaeon]
MTSNRKGFDFGILIHGGAGVKKIKRTDDITRSLKSAVSNGFDLLKRSSNKAVDSVEAAVASMEDSGVFDAGVGSYLTIDKTVEMDASIMDGRDISAGSVGMAMGIKNPIKLARKIMERTDHVMMVSDGVTRLSKLFGNTVEEYPQELNKKILNEYNKLMKNVRIISKKNNKLTMLSSAASQEKSHHHYSTVGAVAIDKDGNVASAVSTGGIWLKMHGRIGDSAIIGSGIYADNKSGAACATGYGEYIMRLCLCKYACDQMQSRNSAHLSSKKSIDVLTERFGKNTGGIITVDLKGRFGRACNTRFMPTAMITNKNQKPVIAFGSG